VAEIVEIVRQNLGRETNGDALGAVEQHDGELGGQRDGLLVAAVVAELPGGGLRIEGDLAGEIREPGLDVTGRCGAVAGERVAEVSLRVDQHAALAHADERGADGGVAVRMVAHGGADDVGGLVEAAVVHFPKRVKDAALDGLEAIVDVRDGAVEDDVAGVVEEPVAVVLDERSVGRVFQFLRRQGRRLCVDHGRRLVIAQRRGRDGGLAGRRVGARGGRGGLGRGGVAVERQLGLVVFGSLTFRHRTEMG